MSGTNLCDPGNWQTLSLSELIMPSARIMTSPRLRALLLLMLSVSLLIFTRAATAEPPLERNRGQGKPVPPDGQVAPPMPFFHVDAGNRVKRFHPLNGVNGGPGHLAPDFGSNDISAYYQEWQVPLVRMHDLFTLGGGYGPGDLSTVFGNDWSQDPADLSNYHWTETDAVVQEIAAVGAKAMFRFGESWPSDSALNNGQALNYIPPEHHQTAARVCSQIAGHYSSLQPQAVQLWEVWNEPNLYRFWDDPGQPGQGRDLDPEEFYALYVAIAKQFKRDHPSLTVGGPGAAGSTDKEVVAFASNFISACKNENAPLDFYSWHSYNRDLEGPLCYARQAQALRQVLDNAGFQKTELVLSEWNLAKAGLNNPHWTPALYDIHGTAFLACALTLLHQESDVRYACLYRGDYLGEYGLFYKDAALRKTAYAFKAYAQLHSSTSAFLDILDSQGGNRTDRTVIATLDKSERELTVLVSFWKSGRDARLVISNLPAQLRSPTIEHHRVSHAYDWESVPVQVTGKSPNHIALALDAPPGRSPSTVHVVKLMPGPPIPQRREKPDMKHSPFSPRTPIQRDVTPRPVRRPPRPAKQDKVQRPQPDKEALPHGQRPPMSDRPRKTNRPPAKLSPTKTPNGG